MGLLDLLKGLPTRNEMKGSFAEQLAKIYSKVMMDALVLHDVLIDGEGDMTSQIDLILVGVRGLYVVEVKFFEDARIYGDGKKRQWYYYRGGKKFNIYSPMQQNKKHVEYLKNFLSDFGDIPIFSVILMICEDMKIQNINEDPNNITTVVCNSLPAMERGMKYLAEQKPIVYTEKQKQEIYDYIVANQHEGRLVRKMHKEKVIQQNKQREEIAAQNLCPYCKTELVLRNGKYGAFYGCSNFPKCRYIKKES